jgi:hypothetical protein
MTPTPESALPRAFWRKHRLLVVQSQPGHVRLTAVGRARLAAAAAREGFAANASIPVERFEVIAMRASEASQTGMSDLRARVNDESVPLAERELLAQLLGYPAPVGNTTASSSGAAPPAGSAVVSLADWRRLRHAA